MNIIVSCKIVPDDQDIQVASDRTLDYSKAKGTVSTYDLNAIEAAAQLAAAVDGSKVTAVTAGPASVDDSKLKKNILARGVDELVMCADDACEGMDAHATAEALAALVGEYDVILMGDGSADNYAQQVDVQLAARLGVPSVNGVTKITPEAGSLLVERTLESVVETVRVPLPAVVSVSPDVAVPRIPGMKDILAAGKKPMDVRPAAGAPAGSVEAVSTLAPEQADRKLEILDASADGAIEQFAAAIKAAL
ncbi:electron transfer flavoprotein [Gordonibacter massiliensis (ex Traore et al. 2017)]|uniref:Electron transfer flavoprotein small subunit n=1 Tax=Gordonibacter massiliensis (ex Traore et al. 2017) TaxID=1841863 RepID=A0A842JJC9_9ACTN|nr:electron transfer flavoprotein [Gordonibacter massiliensis (ex Traore et al. 2017)]